MPEAGCLPKASVGLPAAGEVLPERWWIKFYLLNELAREVDGYLVFMDADMYARRPVDLSPLLTGSVCAFLEIDLATLPDTDWFGLTCGEVVGRLKQLGYDGPAFSLNGGLFAVRSDAVPEFLDHVYRSKRLFRNEQHALVYAIGCMNPAAPMIDDHRDLYDSNTIDASLIPAILDGEGLGRGGLAVGQADLGRSGSRALREPKACVLRAARARPCTRIAQGQAR